MQHYRVVCFGWLIFDFFAFALGVYRSADAQVVLAMPEGRKSLELILVDDEGNLPDSNGRGSVPYRYRISKYEITTSQWVRFLNAKGKSQPDGGLWNNDMDKALSGDGPRCEIKRSGPSGAYNYQVAEDFADCPVSHVSFLDACRFCNWLHNGQADGDTETGAYTLNGYWGTDGRKIQRNPGAKFFIPTEDEWYKAAYYDPSKSGGAGYWKYPTRSDQKPSREIDSTNGANYYSGGYIDPARYFLPVGTFAKAIGPYGTLDQAGNVYEWTEDLKPPFLRTLRGGAFDSDDAGIHLPVANPVFSSISDVANIGIRVAASEGQQGFELGTIGEATEQLAPKDFPRRPWLDPLNGKPFFPLAWFSYASDQQDLDELAEQGANMVLFVNAPADVDTEQMAKENAVAMRNYLDYAQKKQIRVLVQFGGWYAAHMRGDMAEIARQQRWIESIADHPALFGYQLYDEPEYTAGFGLGVPDQKKLKDFVDSFQKLRESIRRWDANPNRMISVVFNLVPLSSWTEYLPTVDSFQVDRYPLDKDQAYFGHRGDWGPLMMAWSMHHGAESMHDYPHLRNPAPCLQGVGSEHIEGGTVGVWRNPLYDETRYMAYSSLTVGSWGVFHWIRQFGRPNNPEIAKNVGRLYREIRELLPALEESYQQPPFQVVQNHTGITRGFLTDSISDVTTLCLADNRHYYLIVCNNGGTFSDLQLRLQGLQLTSSVPRTAHVMNEGWSRNLSYSEQQKDWTLDVHTMCFGDVNIWVIDKD
ncbi:MAG: SUMF1/EgtB/PvdO family nonheme iron enzyme [Planctomycetes bacterium]|nr:SUMF1/EgtB/PvdO family nonheme iron enzyme [Planctomycetota bacterium]